MLLEWSRNAQERCVVLHSNDDCVTIQVKSAMESEYKHYHLPPWRDRHG